MTVGRWERGERKPDYDDLNRILKAYPDISPAWLLTGEGEMKRREVTIPTLSDKENIDKLLGVLRKVYKKGLHTGYTFNPELAKGIFNEEYIPTEEELQDDIDECLSIGDIRLLVEGFNLADEIPIKNGSEVVKLKYSEIDISFLAYVIKLAEEAIKSMKRIDNVRINTEKKAELIADLYSRYSEPIQKDIIQTVKSFHITKKKD